VADGTKAAHHRQLADEQAALRRVATFVASGAEPEEVFRFVSEEVAALLSVETAAVLRFDGEVATVVGVTGELRTIKRGSTFALEADSTVGRVYRTGRSARIDDYEGMDSEIATIIRRGGFRTTVAGPVTVEGRPWGAVVAGSKRDRGVPEDTEERLAEFAELVGLAIASADARQELSRSRARLLSASDTERRRLERNLHDGAQQRLVTLAVTLRIAESKLEDDPNGARDLLGTAREELNSALEELRELARGLHPGVLTERGLEPALESLTQRAPVPVRLTVYLPERCPEAVEVAAYYVAAEALANAIRYSDADLVELDVSRRDGVLRVVVSDDGRGGAEPRAGSGLRGLADRVEALGGRLDVVSTSASGTSVVAELPISEPA